MICWIFWGSLLYILIVLIQRSRERRLSVAESEKQIIRIAIVPVFMILVVWMVSNNGISETSLFIPRYFICLLPFLSICIGGTIALIYQRLCELSRNNLRVKALVFTLICGILLFSGWNGYCGVNGRTFRDPEPYEAAADYLMTQPDIHNDDVGVFCVNYSSPLGWGYYLTHKDTREGITPLFRKLSADTISGLRKIYVFEVHKTLSSETLAFLLVNGFVEQERIEPERIIVFTRVES